MQSGHDVGSYSFSRPGELRRSFSYTDSHISRLRAILRDAYAGVHRVT